MENTADAAKAVANITKEAQNIQAAINRATFDFQQMLKHTLAMQLQEIAIEHKDMLSSLNARFLGILSDLFELMNSRVDDLTSVSHSRPVRADIDYARRNCKMPRMTYRVFRATSVPLQQNFPMAWPHTHIP